MFAVTDAQLDALRYYAERRGHRNGEQPSYRVRTILRVRGLIDAIDGYDDTDTTNTAAGRWILKALNALDISAS